MRKDGKSTYKAINEKLERMQIQQKRAMQIVDAAIENYEKIINSTPIILNIADYAKIWKNLTELKRIKKEFELEETR